LRPHFYNLRNTRAILEKVITLVKLAREFGLAIFRHEDTINTHNMMPKGYMIASNMSCSGWKISLFLSFLLLNILFLLLLIHLVTSYRDFTRRRGIMGRRPYRKIRWRIYMRLMILEWSVYI
jgi:hypothetical protein